MEDRSEGLSSDNLPSSSNSIGNSTLSNIIRLVKQPIVNPNIVEKVRKGPILVDVPKNFFRLITRTYDQNMGFSYRFFPNYNKELINSMLSFSSYSSEKFKLLLNSLNMHYATPLLACCCTGLRGFQAPTKVLVEVMTSHNSWNGRILVLVCAGIGCTVWYSFVHSYNAPYISVFAPIDCYDPFFTENSLFRPEYFKKLAFIEKNDPSIIVENTFEYVRPFADIQIPASGSVQCAVGLGIMIAFLIAVGTVPTEFSDHLSTQLC